MIADLKPYPAMKDSGGSWLGDVPEHWTTVRLKSSMNNIVEQTTERRGSDLYVALEHVESWTGRLRHAGLDVSFDSQVKYFRSGDILFGKLRPYLAKVTRPTSDGVCVGEFLVLRPRHSNATAPYMEQLLRSKPIIDAVNSSTFGAKMPRAEWQFMGGMAIVHPSLPEQAAIVRFLDHADRHIRRYILAKQKLVKLLEEQNKALIHRAVTGQIDVRTGLPYPAYKPSGVEWLGDVPEHWDVLSLCAVATHKSVTGQQHRELLSVYLDRGVIRFSEMQEKRTNVTSADLTKYQAVDPGDFVLNNQQAWRGSVGVSSLSGIVSPAYLVLALSGRLHTDFANLLFRDRAMVDQYLICSRGVGSIQRNLYWPHLKRVTFPSSPISEQVTIVRFLDEAAADIDNTINRTRRQIELLSEYRTRLIADVVTGKLDVRESAAQLPDEVEEPEPFDKTGALINGEEEPSDGLDTAPEEAAV